MKSVYCFYIFVYLLLLSRESDGGLVKNFFDSIHDAAHKVHDDVRNVLHPKENPKKESVDVADVANNNKNDEDIFVFATSTVAPNKEINKEVVDKNLKPKDEDTSKLAIASTSTTQRSVNGTSSVIEKDGKENFAGGCSTGYQRTADGRCKPTF